MDLALQSTRGVHFRYAKLDLTNPSSIEHLARTIKDEQGDVDVLFNVAGLNIMKPWTGSRAFSDNKKIMDVNFQGTLQMCMTFLPIMKPGSRIVNLSSVASSLGSYNQDLQARFRDPHLTISGLQSLAAEYEVRSSIPKECTRLTLNQESAKAGRAAQDGWPESGYSVSKACINAMTAIMAREHADILVNACCPGWVSTEMGRQVGAQPPKSTSA